LGLALAGKMNPLITLFYWAAQLGGGFCAALLVRVSPNLIVFECHFPFQFVTSQQQYDQIAGGATIVPNGQLWYQALTVEVILTGFLLQTVLTCAADTTSNLLSPLAIGMTVALDIFGG
jgi:glycerol uptake facilitator-like aquaporin